MRILVVDDDPSVRDAVVCYFNHCNYDHIAEGVGDVPTARDRFFEAKNDGLPFHAAIVDGMLPDLCREGWTSGAFGPGLAQEFKDAGAYAILLSASDNCLSMARRLGVDAFEKMTSLKTLLDVIVRGVEAVGVRA